MPSSGADSCGDPAAWRSSLLLAIGGGYLAITPALAGHASIESPVVVFFPSDALHVLAASVWVGGIACLLLALPGATRRLEGAERSRLLLAVLARFSPIALGAVIVIAATGVIQAYIDVRSFEGLLHTTYGALIIVKVVLLLVLIGLGWVNRERVIPVLERIVGDGRSPGGIGALARRTMRGELALMLCVFGVTAALISYAPPIDAASGPFSTNTTIGPAELEMTVEPAKVGLNTIHLYLIDAKTGAQFTATKELTATAKLPAEGDRPAAAACESSRGPATTSSAPPCSAPAELGTSKSPTAYPNSNSTPTQSRCPSDERSRDPPVGHPPSLEERRHERKRVAGSARRASPRSSRPPARRRTSVCIPTRSPPGRSRRSTCVFRASRKAPT